MKKDWSRSAGLVGLGFALGLTGVTELLAQNVPRVTTSAGSVRALPDFTRVSLPGGNFVGGAAWTDLDGDGYPDLIIANGVDTPNGARNAVYHNNRNGTFSQSASAPLTTDVGYSLNVALGDYDNDGFPDVFFGGVFGPTPTVKSLVYRNNGQGGFERINTGNLAATMGNFMGFWADYDNDGFLDILLVNTGGPNSLFHNSGDGTFTLVDSALSPAHPSGGKVGNGFAWADYDNDGYPDVFIYGGAGHNSLFHNNRDGTFTEVKQEPFTTDAGHSPGAVWGDYDNDGFLDLFVTNGNFDLTKRANYLYHNNGDGTFTKVTAGAIATDAGSYISAGWEDVDNDGNLDLFVSQHTGSGPATQNAFYHGNGDGTFSRMTNSTLVADSGYSAAVVWGDDNNDGFPDLLLTAEPSYIYHNEGNSNHWFNVRLVGTVSNRSAIGAKVRVKATIHGKSYWQMREISGATGNLIAHFGLGDAASVEVVRVEWPSGIAQELQKIPGNQVTTIAEPARLTLFSNGEFSGVSLQGGRNLAYDIQSSTNLANWSPDGATTITNANGRLNFGFGAPAQRRFFRTVLH